MVVSVVSNEIMRISVARTDIAQRSTCRGDLRRLISYDFPGSLHMHVRTVPVRRRVV